MERGRVQLDSIYSSFNKTVKKRQVMLCATFMFFSVLAGYTFAEERNDSNSSAKDLNPANLNQLLEPRSAEQAVYFLADGLEQDDPARNYALLEAAREHFLERGNPAETAAGLGNFLSEGEDRKTGLTFRVGRGGRIDDPPSLRIAVLDWLADIDLDRAISHSRQILEQAQDAEEAAVALRNLGRHPEIGRSGEFLDQTLAFISNRQWLEEPSPGFFEGFDAFVFAEPYAHLELLLNVPSANPRLTAFTSIVIDTMVQNNRDMTLTALLNQPIFQSFYDDFRPIWFARADVRVPQQRNIVTAYLSHPGVTVEEKQQFFDLFPLYTRMTSSRLLSRDQLLSIHEMVEIDEAALTFLTELLDEAEDDYERLFINQAYLRLNEFADQVARNPRLRQGR